MINNNSKKRTIRIMKADNNNLIINNDLAGSSLQYGGDGIALSQHFSMSSSSFEHVNVIQHVCLGLHLPIYR